MKLPNNTQEFIGGYISSYLDTVRIAAEEEARHYEQVSAEALTMANRARDVATAAMAISGAVNIAVDAITEMQASAEKNPV